jgi:hypothetical protein
LIGLGFASIYPVALGFAGGRYQERSGTVFGILFSIALTGGMTMPWAVAQVSQAWSLRRGMLFIAVGAGMIALLSRVLRRPEAPPPPGA